MIARISAGSSWLARFEPALCAYLEPLVARRRLVVVGDSSSALAGRLLEIGAGMVHVYDPDPLRASATRTQRGITVRPLPAERFDVRDGAFDVLLIPDVGELASVDAVLARARRVVAHDGAVVLGAPARGAVSYEELYDHAALQFERVAMVGIVPFEGAVLAELGERDADPEVSVDTRYAADPSPVAYLAIGARDEEQLEAYSIVALPPSPALGPSHDDLGAQLAAATLRAELLAAQVDEQRTRISTLAAEASRASDGEALRAEVAMLSSRLARAEEMAGEELGRAERAEARFREAEAALSTLRERLAQAEVLVARRDNELSSLHGRVAGLEVGALGGAGAEASEARLVAAEQRVRDLAAQLADAQATLALHVADAAQLSEAHSEELAHLELRLHERALVVGELERELVRREYIVRELVQELEAARRGNEPGPGAEARHVASDPSRSEEELRTLRETLDAMAREAARREGELVAAQWRVEALQGELERVGASGGPEGGAQGDAGDFADDAARGREDAARAHGELARARDEIAALRDALAKEHGERERLESGEALAVARAELARHQVLLDQVRRAPDGR